MGPCKRYVAQWSDIFQSTHPVWDGTLPRQRHEHRTHISIHPSRVGWDHSGDSVHRPAWRISIHPSRVGWDLASAMWRNGRTYFNPPIPCGMGRFPGSAMSIERTFQSTHPVWDGTLKRLALWLLKLEFQSTHPVWDGTNGTTGWKMQDIISIHPSRVGWDQRHDRLEDAGHHFNPPIPCGMGLQLQKDPDADILISIHPSRVGWDY